MKILVACEFTQEATKAFRNKGHEAYSCDLRPTEGKKEWHIQGDVLDYIDDKWDMMIAHPDCTYLCNSGVRWLTGDPFRWEELKMASEFFKILWTSDIPKICIENPIPHKYGELPKYTQIIQPYQFGHGETKATCLWLKNLPKLHHTSNTYDWEKLEHKNIVTGREQRIHKMGPSENRSMERSRSYPGIAEAMADQWQ